MNNDIYAEWLVKQKRPAYAPLVYVGLILLTLVGFIAMLVNAFGFIVLLLALGAWWFIGMRLNLEYEYVFVTNELDIDRIFAQKSRKRVISLEMQNVEKVVSTKSHEYDFARNNPRIKPIDYSSKKADANTYAIIYNGSQGQAVYIIEPNDQLLKCMRNAAPRKVMIEQALTTKPQ